MGRKFEVTGKAVIYTPNGVKVVDAEVRRWFNNQGDGNRFSIKYNEPYVLIGGARDVPADNPYAKPAYHPETIEFAFKYASTKFFRLQLDLMRLAQWEPIHKHNYIMFGSWFTTNHFNCGGRPDIDFTKHVADIDRQFFRKFEFSQHMIDFVEARYS